MNISGVLVHTRLGQAQAVRERLQKIAGVEVHATSPEGRLVVTVETHDANSMADTVMLCQDVDGVLSVAMVYHHYEDDVDSERESTDECMNFETDRSEDSNVQEASK